MKKNWRNKLIVGTRHLTTGTIRLPIVYGALLILILFLVTSCRKNGDHAGHADTYTCPMHPTVVSDKPGACPVCGMDLVKKSRAGDEVKVTDDLTRVSKSSNEVLLSSVRTIQGEFKSMPVALNVQGIVTYDSRYLYAIPARVGGRLEKVLLKSAFQLVRKGQKVAEIYSPEMLTAQRELVYLLENDADNTTIIEAAKNKLQLLGATSNQVDEVVRKKDVVYTFAIYSPYEGYVISESQEVPTATIGGASPAASGMDSGMGGSGSPVVQSQRVQAFGADLIREGNYVAAGQTLFKVVNLSALRVELDLPLADARGVNLNDEVDLDVGAHTILPAKVDFVQPFFNDGETFVKVRLYVQNRGELQIGQLVRARIILRPIEGLWVPREAIVDLGLEKIVFRKERGVFKSKNITIGGRSDGWIEVTQGLSSSDEIAWNAQYLVDNESFIKTK